jgi:ATP-dependent helicase/DNAse subunit B
MPPRLLLAPAGHGKTQAAIQRIRDVLVAEPLAPVMVVVPNMIQAAGFRQRLVAAGGALGVEVHTFHTLYAELLTRAGQPLPLLLDPVRIRLLCAIVDDLCERGEMRYYAALRTRPGFIALLPNAMEELKRARIFPENFAAAVQGRGPQLEEITLVYTGYQDWLQRQNWADHERRGWLAAIALEKNPSLGADTRLLAITGFDEFNPTQLSVLTLLSKRAQETLITLTGDSQRPQRAAHHRFHRAQAALQSSLGVEPEALPSSSLLTPAIAHIEAYLFEPDKTSKVSETSEVSFLEAQNRAAEARAALRWVKARIVRDSLALTDVAVLARDLEPYRPFLEETAAEFGIPLRLVGGMPLAENPAIAALLSLLALPVEDWPRRPMLEAWRSPYFDWTEQGIAPGDAAFLDEISRLGRVTGGLSQWREAFDLWKKRQIIPDKEEDGDSPLPVGEGSGLVLPAPACPRQSRVLPWPGRLDRQAQVSEVEGVMSAFESFIDCITPPTRAAVRQYVAFIENLMGDDPPPLVPPIFARQDIDAFRSEVGRKWGDERGVNLITCARANPSTAERDVAALRAFKDVLRGLVLAESTLRTGSLDYADFYADLRGAVESATYSAAPEAGVLAASVLDARGLSFEAVALLGLSEGEFPRHEREDILLRESDRAALRERGLPLETRLHGDEQTFFYQAVTRARQKLLLTRSYLAQDGQPWEASPYWDEIRRLIGNRPTVRVRPEEGLDPAEAASRPEWVQSAHASDIHVQRGMEALKARLSRRAAGTFEGETPELAEDLAARFGPSHGWSASRLESYGTCPFEFFVAHALGLEPRILPEEGFDVRILGSMLHKILEDVYRSAASLDDCLAILPEKAGAVFATAPQVYGFRPTPLWDL